MQPPQTVGLDEQLITPASGDAAPDVISMGLTWVSQMAKQGALECVNGYDGFEEIASNALCGSLNTILNTASDAAMAECASVFECWLYFDGNV